MTEFKCRRCGKCCLAFNGYLSATTNDIKRWKGEGRTDILDRVLFTTLKEDGEIYNSPDGEILSADLWSDKERLDEANRCPFLKTDDGKKIYRCTIHETKPDVCREYPTEKRCFAGIINPKYVEDGKGYN
jgi:Fe-S-cluster containining protein